MPADPHQPARSDRAASPVTIGCVSFLNARPLIDSLDGRDDLRIRYDVPSRLLDDLTRGEVDLALCPVVDFQLSPAPLRIVPVGGIGSDGPTLTVRLFSRVPWSDVTRVAADTDSHTSVILAQLILAQRLGRRVDFVPLDRDTPADLPDTVLLIGDKVVTNAPDDSAYPHQLDLGEQWKLLTGRPFVFAIWMTRPGVDLAAAPALLDAARRANRHRIDDIVADHAALAGWPDDLARRYLGDLLRYRTGPDELAAIDAFFDLAHSHGLLPHRRPLDLVPFHADLPQR